MGPILVAVDFSERTVPTVRYAAALAVARGQQVDLIHVVSSALPIQLQSHAPAEIIDRIVASEEDAAREGLFKLLEEHVPEAARGRGLTRRGTPSETICTAAREGAYEMVVVCTQGRTGLQHVLIGSVAERVVRWAPCPVLVVR